MIQSEYIAALDLGTSKMIAMVGRKDVNGILSVEASEKIDSGSCMRKGYVYNVEDAGKKVEQLISKMNNRLSPKIEKVYVGIGGQSIQMETYKAIRQVDGIVDEATLNSMKDECDKYDPELYNVIEVLSPEYYLDGHLTASPKGLECKSMEAHYKLILGRFSIENNLRASIEKKANLKIAGCFTTPIASAEAVLTEREKELGCALVEFGAGVTYVSVYKNSFLKHLVTIPIGGNVITKDISTMNILEDEAENLKINWGSAFVELDDQAKIEEHPQIKIKDLNAVIEARLNEILANALAQIELSGFNKENLGAGIIITGGGSKLKRIADVFHKKSDMEVRPATIKKSLVNQAVDWANDNSKTAIIGLLSLGKENCAGPAPITEPDEKGQFDIFGKPEVGVKQGVNTPSGGGKRKMPTPNPGSSSKPGFFNKFTGGFVKAVESASKSLFDEEQANTDREEDENSNTNSNK